MLLGKYSSYGLFERHCYHILKYLHSTLRDALLSKKVQFFLTLFKRPLTPPPFYLNIYPILQGVFFYSVFELYEIYVAPHI